MIVIPTFSDLVPHADDSGWARWRALLARRCGLAIRDRHLPLLADAVTLRKLARGLASNEEYYELLAAEPDGEAECAEIVERIVSHETAFFRHAASFAALRDAILPDLLRRSDGLTRHLSLCCAGCSTGEEAYSIAMVAADACGRGREFLVWGSDISRRAIDAARAGRYDERALSHVPAAYRRYLQASDVRGHYDIAEALRRQVRFLCVNLLAPGGVLLTYDVIFCQNVLIYFAPEAIPRLVSELASRLSVGGYLVLGPGEAPTVCPGGTEAVTFPGVRAFRRTGRYDKGGRG